MKRLGNSIRSGALALAVAITVSGCGGYDLELKGGVFDLLGVNDGPRGEPKMANRAGLVIPPSTASLPAPAPAPNLAIAANGEPFPINPEDAKRTKLANIADEHRKFCEKARERVASGLTDDLESSPYGACHESVLRNLTGKDMSGKKAPGTE